ncbi:uncharacterized protein G2W53_010831 [Senna tora]|uniref:Retrotransposon Copia-like N-terminal domain-containing protein n=1 Tax=Senna tora TaxID=362788 RepID=A0A834X0E0_9FABA|nr:uncharacterized protein G2W53_010831 [Senna tora]
MAEERNSGSKSSKNNEGAYGLHNSDHPGVALVTTSLDGRNYLSWSIAVRTAFEAKDKIGFIDGSIPSPEDASEHKKWKAIDSMIKSWIVNSISKEFSDTFVYCQTSKALWDVLEERFGTSNAPQMYHIQRQTSSLRQGGDSITVYYNKLHRCWDEMDRIMPIPLCTCGKCTCGLKKKLADLASSAKLLQFLMGLNPVYDVVRTQILNLDPLPSANKAFHMVLTDEAQREIHLTYSNGVEGSNALLAKTNQGKSDPNAYGKRKDQAKKDKFCEHCNTNGHTKETCFKLHGYLEWFKELREKRAGKKPTTALVKEGSNTNSDATVTQDSDSSGKNDLTSDQKSRETLARGAAYGNLYYLNNKSFSNYDLARKVDRNVAGKIGSVQCNVASNTKEKLGESMKVWHSRLGHPSVKEGQHSYPLETPERRNNDEHRNEGNIESEDNLHQEEEIPGQEENIAEPEVHDEVTNNPMSRTSTRRKQMPVWMQDYVCWNWNCGLLNKKFYVWYRHKQLGITILGIVDFKQFLNLDSSLLLIDLDFRNGIKAGKT